MSKLLLQVIALLSFTTVFGQLTNISNGEGGAPFRLSAKSESINGTRFFPEEYILGTVIDFDGAKERVMLKFDMYNNAIIADNAGQALQLYNSAYPEFQFSYAEGDAIKDYIFKTGYTFENKPKFYYQVLFSSTNVDLLKKTELEVKTINKTEYGGGTTTVSKFENVDTFYLVDKDGKVITLELKKSKIIDALDNDSGAIKDYIKSQGLKFRQESDLVQVVEFYLSQNA